jgi:peptidoglycan L-alanyl-D-glutamate endopeptidase CwlK
MAITLSPRTLARLEGVHPLLRATVIEAAAMAQPVDDFTILEGVRSHDQMCVNYGKGRTAAQCEAKGVPGRFAQPGAAKVTWLNDPFNSAHRINPRTKFGHAVDAAPYPIDWNDRARFVRLRDLMFAAAAKVGCRIRWGRDWDSDGRYEEKGETDGPHFELVGL